MSRRHDERGSALVELSWLGLLLLVPMLWIVLERVRGPARRLRGEQCGSVGGPGLHARAQRCGRAGPGRGRGAAGAGRPGAGGRAVHGAGHLHAVPRATATAAPRWSRCGCSPGCEVPLLPQRPGWRCPELSPSMRRTPCRSVSTRRSTVPRRDRRRDERGQATVLIVGLATFLAMTIALVVDSTAAYLQRQGLDTLADGAALRGADLGRDRQGRLRGRRAAERLELTAGPGPRGGRRLPARCRRVRPLPGPVLPGPRRPARRRASRSRSARRLTCR